MTTLQNNIEKALDRFDKKFEAGTLVSTARIAIKYFLEQELTSIYTLGQEEARKEM